jgi:hypothetical protein
MWTRLLMIVRLPSALRCRRQDALVRAVENLVRRSRTRSRGDGGFADRRRKAGAATAPRGIAR